MEQEILEAQKLINDSASITVLTGAGVSAESGIPTFRGENGLWRNFRSEDLATPEAFSRDPKLVWEWYEWRRKIIKEDRKSTRLNSSHMSESRMPSSA